MGAALTNNLAPAVAARATADAVKAAGGTRADIARAEKLAKEEAEKKIEALGSASELTEEKMRAKEAMDAERQAEAELLAAERLELERVEAEEAASDKAEHKARAELLAAERRELEKV